MKKRSKKKTVTRKSKKSSLNDVVDVLKEIGSSLKILSDYASKLFPVSVQPTIPPYTIGSPTVTWQSETDNTPKVSSISPEDVDNIMSNVNDILGKIFDNKNTDTK